MSIAVFFLNFTHEPSCHTFADDEFILALRHCEFLRKKGMTHVVMSTELGDQVGKPGVDAVVDGKTPDGHDYEWSKQHRGSGPCK